MDSDREHRPRQCNWWGQGDGEPRGEEGLGLGHGGPGEPKHRQSIPRIRGGSHDRQVQRIQMTPLVTECHVNTPYSLLETQTALPTMRISSAERS